jgi:hypothetical protein
MRMDSGDVEPGMIVRHPGRPDWGIGRVQSAIGHRVTVGFEEAGKVTIDLRHVTLEIVREARSVGRG